jgi:hypothetical protein
MRRVISVSFSTPKGVHGVEWRRNHNWLKIKYKDGGEDQLDATMVLRGDCSLCAEVNTVERKKNGRFPAKTFCTYCGGLLELDSPKRQLAFLSAADLNASAK